MNNKIDLEHKLKKEQIKSHNYFELSPTLTLILDVTGIIININQAGCKILGGDKKNIVGKNWFDVFLPEDIQEDFRKNFLKVISQEKQNEDMFPDGFTNNIITVQGNIKTIEWYNTTLLDETSGNVIYQYSTGIDITERVHLEEKVRQSAKLEAVGLLAGGIAHDFNNILTIIYGYSEMLTKKLRKDDDSIKIGYVLERLKKVISASQRASSLVKQLLAFSRKQLMNPVVFNINTILNEEREGLHKFIRENIELSYYFDEHLGNIYADKNEVQNVLLNILINSRDAINNSGNIIIETKNIQFNENVKHKKTFIEKGLYVMVAITDDGVGMDKQTVNRIFDPFFTTKELGHGVGLGLSAVYGIIKQSKGYIWVYSELNKGTTFKLYFPRVDAEESTYIKEDENYLDYNGTETILVVEDEQNVREMISETLRDGGYTVVCASDGIKALNIIEVDKVIPDLILTDVVMPKMDGKELVLRVGEKFPNIKILYMSGYTDNTIIHRGVLDSGTNFIQKPTTPIQLMKRIRKILNTNK